MDTVEQVADIHEVEAKPMALYSVAMWIGILSIVAMPFYIIYIIGESRNKIIMDHARKILLAHYDVELKNNC